MNLTERITELLGALGVKARVTMDGAEATIRTYGRKNPSDASDVGERIAHAIIESGSELVLVSNRVETTASAWFIAVVVVRAIDADDDHGSDGGTKPARGEVSAPAIGVCENPFLEIPAAPENPGAPFPNAPTGRQIRKLRAVREEKERLARMRAEKSERPETAVMGQRPGDGEDLGVVHDAVRAVLQGPGIRARVGLPEFTRNGIEFSGPDGGRIGGMANPKIVGRVLRRIKKIPGVARVAVINGSVRVIL